MPKTANKPDRLQEAHDRLTQAVESIVSGDDWQRMLQVAAKFHNYSFNNQLLIFLQRPDARHVAGFNRWKSLGRFVKKGEKGIAILAPIKQTVKAETSDLAVEVAAEPHGEDRPITVLRGFKVAHVFDISQTEGEPLEDVDAVRPKLLDGDAPEGIWEVLVAQANDAGFEVVRDRKGSENGYCDFLGKKIAVRSDVSPAQALKTLIHELGHALLHSEDRPKTATIAEVEVESVAFIVCDALGFDTAAYSFPYVARWSGGQSELIKDTAERSVSCARKMLAGLEVAACDVAVEAATPNA